VHCRNTNFGTPSSPTNCLCNPPPATLDRPIRSGQKDGSPLFPQDPVNFIDDDHFQVVQAVIFFRAAVVFSGDPSPPSSSWRIGPPAAVQAAMANSSMARFSPNRV
ncbi:hypothetical protein ACLOJK_018727, partial [Asimina triloba]